MPYLVSTEDGASSDFAGEVLVCHQSSRIFFGLVDSVFARPVGQKLLDEFFLSHLIVELFAQVSLWRSFGDGFEFGGAEQPAVSWSLRVGEVNLVLEVFHGFGRMLIPDDRFYGKNVVFVVILTFFERLLDELGALRLLVSLNEDILTTVSRTVTLIPLVAGFGADGAVHFGDGTLKVTCEFPFLVHMRCKGLHFS